MPCSHEQARGNRPDALKSATARQLLAFASETADMQSVQRATNLKIDFQKRCNAANSLQELLPTLVAPYLAGRHCANLIDQTLKFGACSAAKIQFDWSGFFDQYKTPRIE
jgi:hypothetical protein